MGKCFICSGKTAFMCTKCESIFCEDHGDLNLLLCQDCLEYEHITKEENTKALEREFSVD